MYIACGIGKGHVHYYFSLVKGKLYNFVTATYPFFPLFFLRNAVMPFFWFEPAHRIFLGLASSRAADFNLETSESLLDWSQLQW